VAAAKATGAALERTIHALTIGPGDFPRDYTSRPSEAR
jgi:hypothetical protein